MMLSTREAFGDALAEIGADYDFYVLDADLSKATQTVRFARKYPDRFLDLGIAEANMMSFAAGLSTCGVPVFASTFATFAAGRAYDQVRNAVAYARCNVKIGATHGGVLIGADGGSHQCVEDIALMRAIPEMVVLCPCDAYQTAACVKAALLWDGPVYLRFGRLATPAVYSQDEPHAFEIGKGHLLRNGKDITFVAIGDLVHTALQAAEILHAQGLDAAVIDMASIKPLDEALLLSCAQKTGCFVTAEDHSVLGGLGGAVCELLAETLPCPVERIGLRDRFGCSGSPAELREYFELDAPALCRAAKRALQRKQSSI